MANHLIKPFVWRAFTAFALMAFLQAQAQTMQDPTRPADATAMAGFSASDGAVAGTVLQSVILQKGKKPVAVISGQVVPLGGKFGESQLIRLTEKEAVLRGSEGDEKLFLTPGIEKKIVKTPTQKTATKRVQKRKS